MTSDGSDGGSKIGRLGAVAAIVGTLAALVFGIVAIWQSERGLTASERRPAKIEVTDFSVTDARRALGGQKLDITLHNRGDELVVVKRVLLRVLDKGVVRSCYVQGGGGGPIEADPYDAFIPSRTAVGEVVPIDLRYSIDGDEARRVAIHVTSPKREQLDIGVGEKRAIYQLGVELVTGAESKVVPVDKALVALPYPPYGVSFHWTTDLRSGQEIQATFGAGSFPFDALPCWRRNADTLARILARPGERAPRLRELESEVTQPWE